MLALLINKQPDRNVAKEQRAELSPKDCDARYHQRGARDKGRAPPLRHKRLEHGLPTGSVTTRVQDIVDLEVAQIDLTCSLRVYRCSLRRSQASFARIKRLQWLLLPLAHLSGQSNYNLEKTKPAAFITSALRPCFTSTPPLIRFAHPLKSIP